MGATVPVRPQVDRAGVAWVQRGRFWWAGEFAGGHYHVTFNERIRDGFDVIHSDGRSPFKEVPGPAATEVLEGLKGWIVATGGELPQ